MFDVTYWNVAQTGKKINTGNHQSDPRLDQCIH